MRTRAAFLKQGVAAVLDRIIETARARGYRWLHPETGAGPAFEAAHRLYLRNGFAWSKPSRKLRRHRLQRVHEQGPRRVSPPRRTRPSAVMKKLALLCTHLLALAAGFGDWHLHVADPHRARLAGGGRPGCARRGCGIQGRVQARPERQRRAALG
ncbi:MAG: hypothetical protein U1F25_17710 [Rubrivivax sp.]